MQHGERMPAPADGGKHTDRRRRYRSVTGSRLLWALALLPLVVAADEHEHTPLEVSATLTWPELIDTTLANVPQFIELAAIDTEAAALVRRSHSWLSGAPAVSARYQSDQFWDDVNLRETEIGIELPLWRIGERQAAESVGQAAQGEATAAAIALRHEVIGLLRMALWDIELAGNELAVARDSARVAEDLLAAVERRYDAGEIPRSETLLLRSAVMERQAAVIAAEAQTVDAERAFQSLTGLMLRPAAFAEVLTGRDSFDSSHPLLQLADAELERARAELELTRYTARGAPALTIAPQRDSGAFSNYSATSLNVSIAIPVGGRAHADVETAAASRQATTFEAGRRRLLRELDLELHEARHGLEVIEHSLELAEQRAMLAQQSFEVSQLAFIQGEISVFELLRAEETAMVTKREATALDIERQRNIAQINQAIGVWP